MRIRTVKPEFWNHPVMSKQDDATRLMALGLLNYADDEGYFCADAPLVRASLRPFDDDSSIVRRSLARLAELGYIELREHPTHGMIGLVLSFTTHQRVDRGKSSVLKHLYDSTNDRRTIDDASGNNVAVSGIRDQGSGKGEVQRADDGRPVEAPANAPTLDQALSFAKDNAITADCAEKWYWNHDAVNWLDRYSKPIPNWRSSLRGYWKTWAENERRDALLTKSTSSKINSLHGITILD